MQLLAARTGTFTLECLQLAVGKDDVEEVRVLLESDASITQAHSTFLTAVRKGSKTIVQRVTLWLKTLAVLTLCIAQVYSSMLLHQPFSVLRRPKLSSPNRGSILSSVRAFLSCAGL